MLRIWKSKKPIVSVGKNRIGLDGKVWCSKETDKFGKPTVSGSKCRVRTDGDMLEVFEVVIGMKHDRMSWFLFNVALENAL